jgi:16S rRNA (guanine(527)-N(7))-methyltransferase RsmG
VEVPCETVTMNENELNRVADWLDVLWTEGQTELLMRYEQWLLEEAMTAGGVGPAEGPRLFDRHIADSLAFLPLIPPTARSLVDVGSGVGLPAIPIAIARPEVAVTIVDRSEKRTHLARRAVRILRLGNVTTKTSDVAEVEATFDVVTFRASLPIGQAVRAFRRLGTEEGIGLFAWSRLADPKSPPDAPSDTIFQLVSEGSGVLDSPAWILRMQRSR